MRCFLIPAVFVLLTSEFAPAQSQIDDIWNKVKAASSKSSNAGLTNERITAGLKEALTLSTGKAVAETGRPDGFLKNEAIKIPLPPNLKSVAKGMRMVGMGPQVDQLEVGMNRAAEQATPEAKRIFISTLTRITFADARNILSGGDTAATDYFKSHSSTELTEAFTPIVHRAMENVGVIQQFDRMMKNPGASMVLGNQRFNLEKYVVGKTLDGLFYMLGQEEKKIRTDPAAQTTALLRQVFGNKP